MPAPADMGLQAKARKGWFGVSQLVTPTAGHRYQKLAGYLNPRCAPTASGDEEMPKKDQRRDYDGRYQKKPSYAGKNLRQGKITPAEVENFSRRRRPEREALVQCWRCNRVMLLDPDRGMLRMSCRSCGGNVEVLTIDGIPQ